MRPQFGQQIFNVTVVINAPEFAQVIKTATGSGSN